MKNIPDRRSAQNGQATMELLAALLSIVAVVLGMIFVAGLCIGNVETLIEAKGNADAAARVADPSGPGAGNEIRDWQYTVYKGNRSNGVLPFLSGDRSFSVANGVLEQMQHRLDDYGDSAAMRSDDAMYGSYVPLTSGELPLYTPDRNFSAQALSFASAAAGLVQTKASNRDAVMTISPDRSKGSFSRADMLKLNAAFRELIGVDTLNIDLDAMTPNRVSMPRMELLESSGAINLP